MRGAPHNKRMQPDKSARDARTLAADARRKQSQKTIWGETYAARTKAQIFESFPTLGVFLIRAAKDPLSNARLIWFTVWSSIVHGGIMLVQAIVDETDRINMLGDIPGLFIVAFVLWYFMPKKY